MSEIKHQWNGTVLTVITDSGASSADLVGPRGETGPRGPQGPAGVIYDTDGQVIIDLSQYYTVSEVDNLIENVEVDLTDYATKTYVTESIANADLDNYATKTYVAAEIAKAQLEGAEVDTSGFATVDYVNSKVKEAGQNVDLTSYYTKAEVDALIASLTGTSFASAEEVYY